MAVVMGAYGIGYSPFTATTQTVPAAHVPTYQPLADPLLGAKVRDFKDGSRAELEDAVWYCTLFANGLSERSMQMCEAEFFVQKQMGRLLYRKPK